MARFFFHFSTRFDRFDFYSRGITLFIHMSRFLNLLLSTVGERSIRHVKMSDETAAGKMTPKSCGRVDGVSRNISEQ